MSYSLHQCLQGDCSPKIAAADADDDDGDGRGALKLPRLSIETEQEERRRKKRLLQSLLQLSLARFQTLWHDPGHSFSDLSSAVSASSISEEREMRGER